MANRKKRLNPGSKDGRPTDLTPKLQEEICTYIEAGAYIETAAAAAGIHKATLYEWLKRSKEKHKGYNIIYKNFNDALQKAMARAELRDIKNIHEASKTNWQASAWKLERKFPDRWGRKDRNETVVTVKPYVIESPDGSSVMKLGAEKGDFTEIDIKSIEASEQTYYDCEIVEGEDTDVDSKDKSDE